MKPNIETLCHRLESICADAERMETRFAAELAEVHPAYRDSARNLVHYLALRQADIRDMQSELAALGLSSLGRAERHALESIRAVIRALRRMSAAGNDRPDAEPAAFEQSRRRLDSHIEAIFGPRPGQRSVRIMVTLASETADDYSQVRTLMESGMDVARINCAHDSQAQWSRMIRHIERAEIETGRSCNIVMDLAGPKLRTGMVKPGPAVLRIRPRRDAFGRVIAPRRLLMVPGEAAAVRPGKSELPVSRECIDYAEPGDEFRFRDLRGKKRKLIVLTREDDGLLVEAYQAAYIATGTRLKLRRRKSGEKVSCRVGDLPPAAQPIVLSTGDILVLHKGANPGEPAKLDDDGSVIDPAHISCTLPELFRHVCAGARVSFNDGKIEGIVESVSGEELLIRITHAGHKGSRLRGGKGINFPDTELPTHALTEIDKRNLGFVVTHADAIGLSFIRSPDDILALQNELATYTERHPGVICKIETEQAFSQLPRLLLAAMRRYPAAVMIARGDLAVECGWARLAEMQEEILWLCEAAEMPVVWATQVLEGETRKGRPSRAEITDAAVAQRADCVMLNKGPYVVAAAQMLDSILKRMQGHQSKKTSLLRKLSIAEL